MTLLRSEVLKNRQTAVARLLDPNSKKEKGKLVQLESINQNMNEASACCLGHMCIALEIPHSISKYQSGVLVQFGTGRETTDSIAPHELRKKLGLYHSDGSTKNCHLHLRRTDGSLIHANSLTRLNDHTDMTTQEIGEYLQNIIEGGALTPWKPLSDYPETVESIES